MKYKEPFLSRLIYRSRLFFFKLKRLNKKVHKALNNLSIYLSGKYFAEKRADKSTQITTPSKFISSYYSENDLLTSVYSDKLVVYTCIFGCYDMICEPLYKSKNCEYYIITDCEIPENSVWKKIEFTKPEGFDDWGPSYKNRWCKMHPHIIFPDFRYSLYVDGNVKILTDVYRYVPQLNNRIMGIHNHPLYDCFYQNSVFLESLNLVDEKLNKQQVAHYKTKGFPEHFGYFECGIILRDHNRQKCIDVMNEWWLQYNTYVHRDQQGLMYSLWINGLTKNDIFCLGANLRKSPDFLIKDHNKKHAIVKERAPVL